MASRPTLLRWPELDLIGRSGHIVEDILPKPPEAYQVASDGAWWTVREVATAATRRQTSMEIGGSSCSPRENMNQAEWAAGGLIFHLNKVPLKPAASHLDDVRGIPDPFAARRSWSAPPFGFMELSTMKSLPPNQSEARPVRSGVTLLTAALLSGCAGMQTLDQQKALWSQAQASLTGSPQARIEACAGAPMSRRTDGSITTVQYGITEQFSGASSWCVVDVSFQNGVVSGFSSRSANPGGLTDGSPTCGLIFDNCYGTGTAVQDAYSFAGTVSITRMRGEAGQEIASAQRAGQSATNEAIRSFLTGPLAGGSGLATLPPGPSAGPAPKTPGVVRGPAMAPLFPVPRGATNTGSTSASAGETGRTSGGVSADVPAAPATRGGGAPAGTSPVGSSERAPAGRGADGCEPSLAFIEPRLPICRNHSQLMEYRNIVLASYDEISNARAQGTSYEEIAKTATASAREFDDMMKQSERSMLEVSANAQMARERLAALRATPPRCDADERSMGMAEAAFRAYAVYYMASIGNRAVAAIAACRARAGL